MLLDTLPSVTNCHTFSDPLVLYGRPLKQRYVELPTFHPSLVMSILSILTSESSFKRNKRRDYLKSR